MERTLIREPEILRGELRPGNAQTLQLSIDRYRPIGQLVYTLPWHSAPFVEGGYGKGNGTIDMWQAGRKPEDVTNPRTCNEWHPRHMKPLHLWHESHMKPYQPFEGHARYVLGALCVNKYHIEP